MRLFEEENGQYCLSFCREEEGCERCKKKVGKRLLVISMKGKTGQGRKEKLVVLYLCVCLCKGVSRQAVLRSAHHRSSIQVFIYYIYLHFENEV